MIDISLAIYLYFSIGALVSNYDSHWPQCLICGKITQNTVVT